MSLAQMAEQSQAPEVGACGECFCASLTQGTSTPGYATALFPSSNLSGLQHTATGTFESPAVDRVQAANHLSQVLRAVADPQQLPQVHAQAFLKHLWVYIDRVV
jgi:hypothetical protein